MSHQLSKFSEISFVPLWKAIIFSEIHILWISSEIQGFMKDCPADHSNGFTIAPFKQESPPAWMQEAYRCLVGGGGVLHPGGGGTQPGLDGGGRYPHPRSGGGTRGRYPIPGLRGYLGKVPHPRSEWVPQSGLDAGGYPIPGWGGTPARYWLWGGYPIPGLGRGHPVPGLGGVPRPGLDGGGGVPRVWPSQEGG